MDAEHTTSLVDFKEACGIQEEQGFDVPFVTLTWAHWQDIRAQAVWNAHHELPHLQHHLIVQP